MRLSKSGCSKPASQPVLFSGRRFGFAKKPKAVWFQLGIRNDEAAKKLVAAGIDVVQDRCLLVDYRRYG